MSSLLAEQGRVLLEQFGVALARLRKRSSERRVHTLRIRVKKLRSLFRVVHAVVPGGAVPPKGAHGRLKALFHAAGRQREAQVSVRVVDELPGVSGRDRKVYRQRLAKRSDKAGAELDKALGRLKDRDLERLGAYLAEVTEGLGRTRERQGARRYIDAQLEEAGKVLHAGEPPVALHDVRKHLKNAWHTLRLLAEADALYARQKELMERLAVLQEDLGDWQDTQVLLTDLDRWKGGGAVRDRLRKVAARQLERKRVKLLAGLGQVLG